MPLRTGGCLFGYPEDVFALPSDAGPRAVSD